MSRLASVQDNHIMVIDEYDVIVMRQMVRQMARQNQANLAQQARITAAISGVARELIVQGMSVLFTVLVTQGVPPALEVCCRPQVDPPQAARLNFEHNPNVKDAHRLVDETIFALNDGQPHLTLRIWLGQPGSGL